jgi:glycosyltransferase involved in cell wall biosynthesis
VVQEMDAINRNAPKRILYITYDGLTDPLGQSQVLPYLCGLAKLGFSFTIISFEKKARMQKEGALIKSITSASSITWIPLPFTSKPPIISKIFDRNRMQRLASKMHKLNPFNLIHCRSYIAAEVGLKLKEATAVPFIFDMRGFWADEKVDNGQWNLKRPLFKYIYKHYKSKEKQFLLKSDGIISLTHAAKDYLLKKRDFSQLSIDVIPCCADLDHFNYINTDKLNKEAILNKLRISSEDKIICYLGSVGGWYMMKEMLLFFKLLHLKDSRYVFLILTKEDPALVYEMAKELGINQEAIKVGYSARNELPSVLSVCILSIFFIRNTFSKIASSPTKLGELMGIGIPVICNSIGDTSYIIKETGAGILVDDFSISELEKTISLVNELENIPKDSIRKGAVEFFDLQSGIEKYNAVYKRIFNEQTSLTALHAEA